MAASSLLRHPQKQKKTRPLHPGTGSFIYHFSCRTVYPQIPPKVEYTLTERGRSLMKVLDMLCDWGMENRPK